MNQNEVNCRHFSVIHKVFYYEFTSWLKEMINGSGVKHGVYTLYANKPIGRALGIDAEGILYIGKGVILNNGTRIGKLINSLNNTEQIHEAGNRYNLASYKEFFPIESIKLKVELVENARLSESEKLNDYFDKFGELPPLNRNM